MSQHFGRAPFYGVLTVEDNKVIVREKRDTMSHAQFAGEPHGHAAHASNGHGSIWSHKTGMLAWRKGKE